MGRSRLQFHLSTAVVMMLVAGALLGLNLRQWPHKFEGPPGRFSVGEEVFDSGWPFLAYEHWDFKGTLLGVIGTDVFCEWHYAALAGDVLVALAIIVACGVVCEWRIRRRAPRAPSSVP